MKALLLSLLSLLLIHTAVAQTQHEMNQQAAADAAKADSGLNKAYKAVLAAQVDEEAVKLLKAAQKAWLAFRDAEAKHAEDDARGGSMAPLLYYGRLAQLTEERTKQLKEKLPGEEEPEPIVLPTGGKSAKAAAEAFFKAYKAHDKNAASAVAVARALNAVNWDPRAGEGAELSFEGTDTIRYEGGSMRLLTRKTEQGAWFVVDIEYTAD